MFSRSSCHHDVLQFPSLSCVSPLFLCPCPLRLLSRIPPFHTVLSTNKFVRREHHERWTWCSPLHAFLRDGFRGRGNSRWRPTLSNTRSGMRGSPPSPLPLSLQRIPSLHGHRPHCAHQNSPYPDMSPVMLQLAVLLPLTFSELFHTDICGFRKFMDRALVLARSNVFLVSVLMSQYFGWITGIMFGSMFTASDPVFGARHKGEHHQRRMCCSSLFAFLRGVSSRQCCPKFRTCPFVVSVRTSRECKAHPDRFSSRHHTDMWTCATTSIGFHNPWRS